MIVTVTPNPAIDVSTSVDRVEPDRKLRCDEPQREPGGGGLNVARVARRLGADVLALWAKGGATGHLLHELLDADGLPHRPVVIDGIVRESFAVLERSSGRQYRFGTPGPTLKRDGLAGLCLALAEIEPAPRFVVASGSLPPGADEDFFAQLAAAARRSNALYILDTQGEPLSRALAAGGVYMIKPNLRELAALTGRELQGDDEIADAAADLVERGRCEAVLASIGAGGAWLVTRQHRQHIVAPTVPVRSRIGAGDSTVAGLAVALLRGEPIDRAARFAVASGAAAVITPGTELARKDDVERLYAQMIKYDAGGRERAGSSAQS